MIKMTALGSIKFLLLLLIFMVQLFPCMGKGGTTSVAIVLNSTGTAPAIPSFLLLKEGDKIVIKGGSVTIKFLSDGHRETANGSGSVTVTDRSLHTEGVGISVTATLPQQRLRVNKGDTLLGDRFLKEALKVGLGDESAVGRFRPVKAGFSRLLTLTPDFLNLGGTSDSPVLFCFFEESEWLHRVEREPVPIWKKPVKTARITYPPTAPPIKWGKRYHWISTRITASGIVSKINEKTIVNEGTIEIINETAMTRFITLKSKTNPLTEDLIEEAAFFLSEEIPELAVPILKEIALNKPEDHALRLILIGALWAIGEEMEAQKEKKKYERDFPENHFPLDPENIPW